MSKRKLSYYFQLLWHGREVKYQLNEKVMDLRLFMWNNKFSGLMIAVIRGLTSISAIEKSWLPVRRDVPRAPGLGLMLEEVGLNAHLTAKSVSF